MKLMVMMMMMMMRMILSMMIAMVMWVGPCFLQVAAAGRLLEVMGGLGCAGSALFPGDFVVFRDQYCRKSQVQWNELRRPTSLLGVVSFLLC
ncbi:hypothetical protein DFJ73DRAFT_816555, partial [Zopfochytrium polystomum]